MRKRGCQAQPGPSGVHVEQAAALGLLAGRGGHRDVLAAARAADRVAAGAGAAGAAEAAVGAWACACDCWNAGWSDTPPPVRLRPTWPSCSDSCGIACCSASRVDCTSALIWTRVWAPSISILTRIGPRSCGLSCTSACCTPPFIQTSIWWPSAGANVGLCGVIGSVAWAGAAGGGWCTPWSGV